MKILSKNIKTTIIILAFSISSLSTVVNAQGTVVQDKGVNGQLKRMVYEKWNQWEPSPDWHKVFGVPVYPKSTLGWAYWGILKRPYWKGEDRRPYRTKGGPFMVTDAMGLLQQSIDKKVADSIKADFITTSKEYLYSLGGAGDMAWNAYFGGKFDENLTKITSLFLVFEMAHPKAYSALRKDDRYTIYNNFIKGETDNILAIHNSYLDMGERIKTYFEELRRIELKNESFAKLMNRYIVITEQLPSTYTDNSDQLLSNVGESDRQLVNRILSTYKF